MIRKAIDEIGETEKDTIVERLAEIQKLEPMALERLENISQQVFIPQTALLLSRWIKSVSRLLPG